MKRYLPFFDHPSDLRHPHSGNPDSDAGNFRYSDGAISVFWSSPAPIHLYFEILHLGSYATKAMGWYRVGLENVFRFKFLKYFDFATCAGDPSLQAEGQAQPPECGGGQGGLKRLTAVFAWAGGHGKAAAGAGDPSL
jgi:hypothetical protein